MPKTKRKSGKSSSLSSQKRLPVRNQMATLLVVRSLLILHPDVSETEFRVSIKLDDGRHEDEEDLDEERMLPTSPFLFIA